MANPERPFNQASSLTNDVSTLSKAKGKFTDLDGKIVEMRL